MSILPKAIYRFKLPMVFFRELEQIISQFVWKYKKTRIAKAILRKKNEPEESTCLTSSYTTKLQSSRSMVLAQRNIDQWNKIESPELNPHMHGHLTFDKGSMNTFNFESYFHILFLKFLPNYISEMKNESICFLLFHFCYLIHVICILHCFNNQQS